MKILFLGDVTGRSGRDAVVARLRSLKEETAADFTVINGENAAHGKGITTLLSRILGYQAVGQESQQLEGNVGTGLGVSKGVVVISEVKAAVCGKSSRSAGRYPRRQGDDLHHGRSYDRDDT